MTPLRQALGAAYPLPAMDPDTVRSISAGLARIERKQEAERIAAPMREDVMLLASKAHESMMEEARGFDLWGIETPVRDVQEFCTRFAALVAEAERERLAQHCESPKRTEEGWWSLTAEEIRRGVPE